jgi:hypothetical protein
MSAREGGFGDDDPPHLEEGSLSKKSLKSTRLLCKKEARHDFGLECADGDRRLHRSQLAAEEVPLYSI